MKQAILFSFLLFAAPWVKAQNVGIGTSSPTEKLEVHNPVSSVVKISSANYNDTSRLILSNRDNTNAGTDFLLTAVQEQGLLISARSDLSVNNNDSMLVLKTSGRLGLGVKNPATKLDVNGGGRISGFNTLEFGGGVAGKETNAGKIGYRSFTADALDIVGAGSGTTDRKVKLYAEGGTTLTGPINIAGALQVYGNSGTAGQVLSSNGNGAPSWVNTAYTNNTRFGILLSGTGVFSTLAPQTVYYNTNTTDAAVGASSIIINHTGLYHFNGYVDGQITGSLSFSSPPDFYMVLNVSPTVGGNYNLPLLDKQMERSTANINPLYKLNGLFEQDLYIVAPTTIAVQGLFNYQGTVTGSSLSCRARLFGYRISD